MTDVLGCRLTPQELTRLLASIRAGRLVIVCGAGLSMAPPSKVPSAQEVAEVCFEEYRRTVDPNVDPALRSNLEALAQYFADLNILETVFIEEFVPWKRFLGPPNSGHAAIADFLIIRAAVASLSSNFDTLIEQSALEYGSDFRGALEGHAANVHSKKHSPLLKFHGCFRIDRERTVWAISQIHDNATIANRIEKNKAWITANLGNKDLLIVGFWSDWDYLNRVLGSALNDVGPLSVTLVDPSDVQVLEDKAPDLWAIAHSDNVDFHHIQESGAEVLDELRRAFSKNYLRQVLEAGKQHIESETESQSDPKWFEIADFDSESLYGWRRDAEGVPTGEPARNARPSNIETLGLLHLLLRQAGGQQTEYGYKKDGKTIRVINGAGVFLASLRKKFLEAPTIPTADFVVASGAIDSGQPSNIARQGRTNDIVRPEPGGKWLDFDGGRRELKI